MRVLIIGCSSIVRKRIFPALQQIEDIDCIDIATRSSALSRPVLDKLKNNGIFYTGYAEALSSSKADLVYVSIVNSHHAQWVEKALAQGRHVVVDKPAFTSLGDATRIAEMAQRKGLLLAEATVYGCHPQIDLARKLFLQAETFPTRLSASFSFPTFDENNFRLQKQLGGGALWDLGPYAITPGRLFFEAPPDEILCRVANHHPVTGIETAFSMLAVYPGGRTMVGHFGFNTEYRNRINILGPGLSIDIDRIFTTPPDLENELSIRSKNVIKTVTAPPADSFLLFLRKVIDALRCNEHHRFAEYLVSDAVALGRLRKAAGED